VVRGAIEADTRSENTSRGVRQRGPGGIENGVVEQAGCARRRRCAAAAVPGVEAYVVVIAPRGDERGLAVPYLLDLEPEHAHVEGQGAIEVGHLEVGVPDRDARVDGPARLVRRLLLAH